VSESGITVADTVCRCRCRHWYVPDQRSSLEQPPLCRPGAVVSRYLQEPFVANAAPDRFSSNATRRRKTTLLWMVSITTPAPRICRKVRFRMCNLRRMPFRSFVSRPEPIQPSSAPPPEPSSMLRQKRHEQISRERLRVRSQQRTGLKHILQSAKGTQKGGIQSEPVWRNLWRTHLSRPHFFLRRLPGSAKQPGYDQVLRSTLCRDENGDFRELSAAVYPLTALATGQTGCITNRVIAANCLDPVGVKLASLFPDPNDATVPVWTGNPKLQLHLSCSDKSRLRRHPHRPQA